MIQAASPWIRPGIGCLLFSFFRNYSGPPSHIRISNTSCSFSPLTWLKMLICGGGALLGFFAWKAMSFTCKHDDSLLSMQKIPNSYLFFKKTIDKRMFVWYDSTINRCSDCLFGCYVRFISCYVLLS